MCLFPLVSDSKNYSDAGVIRKAHSDSPLFSSSPSKGLTWAMVTWIGNGTTGTGD
jgi:hypothetical protein